jgi:hypothetical protein
LRSGPGRGIVLWFFAGSFSVCSVAAYPLYRHWGDWHERANEKKPEQEMNPGRALSFTLYSAMVAGKHGYAINRRRTMPAAASKPLPSMMKLPGSGVALVVIGAPLTVKSRSAGGPQHSE